MKILYIANARIPTFRAYGLQIMKTCEAFAAADAEVELLFPTRSYKVPDDPFEYYGIAKRFAIASIPTPDFLHLNAPGFFLSTVWFSEKVRWRPLFWKADIVYSRDPLLLLQYVFLGRPLYFEAHARPTLASRIVARFARKVVVISNGLKRAYESAGVPAGKIIVAPDAVDERLFDSVADRASVRAVLGLPQDKKIVGYAGHLYPRKGAATLAEAARKLPDVLFVFAGGTPEDVGTFKEKWGSLPNVLIIGHVPHSKVPLYLRAADILALPNSGKDEDASMFTSPMKLFEYMLSGTPIVASNVPALREVLDETSALFVRSDEPDALAAGIREMLTYPKESALREAAARRKVENYTWGKRAAAILPVL